MATTPPASSSSSSSPVKKAPTGELKKHTLTRHVRFGCERQLLLDIGQGDPRWLTDLSPLHKAPFRPQSSQVLFDLGHAFEQRVYTRLSHDRLDTRAARGPDGAVHTRKMDAARWRALVSSFLDGSHDVAFLLEHEFDAPEDLLKRWLGADPAKPLPILEPQRQLRPDITLLHRPDTGSPRRALDHLGHQVILHPDDERLAVTFVDIKYTNRESVGKKHYIELLYYAQAFALYIFEQGLDDLLYVPLRGHGILPQFDDAHTNILDPDDFFELVEPLLWHDHAHLIEQVARDLCSLHARAPMHPRDASFSLQPACVLCPYLGECQHLTGYDPEKSAHPDAAVDLLAYTSSSVVEQLKPHGIAKIKDLDTTPIPDPQTPTPLAAERPMLGLKARALITGEAAWASEESAGSQRHMSMAIPRYTDSVVTFAAEQDPTNDRVFVYAVSLDLRLKDARDADGQPVLRPYAELHDRLWTRLEEQLRRPHLMSMERAADLIYPDEVYNKKLEEYTELDAEQLRSRQLIRLRRMVELLKRIDKDGEVIIDTSREQQEHVHVKLMVGDLNGGHEDLDERKLVRQLVHHAVAVVEIVALYEELCLGLTTRLDYKTQEREEVFDAPNSGLFYWSYDQLDHVRDLLERHLVYLMTSSEVYPAFRQLIDLVTPSASGIQRHYRNRKLFDLRQFVETSVGLPQVINYTWHETAHGLLPHSPRYDQRYWSAHYNYMYFGMWHAALDHGTHADLGKIIHQASVKARTIGQLVRTFQAQARFNDVISAQSYYPMKTRDIASHRDDVPKDYHFIARAWVLYNMLDSTIQEETAVAQRLTFPLKSIGKLVAAHITNLAWRELDPKALQITFTLEGLSSNAKFKPGSYAYILHETRRDIRPHAYGKDTLIIDEMEWDTRASRYRVTARAYSHDGSRPGQGFTLTEHPGLSLDGWYLYDTTIDIWTARLERAMGERNLATSWLGARRSYLMGLMPADEALHAPKEWSFDVAECAMFAPDLLPKTTLPQDFELLTRAHPPLDDSKREALKQVFQEPVSCILGPPGTGKSQAIAALIDEFLTRHPTGPVKILVSASSYEPMNVVLEKINKHKDIDGNPTRAATIEKVWLHSASREPRQDLVDQGVRHFCIDGPRMLLDGESIQRRKKSRLYEGEKWRMEDELPDRFILCGVPHQLSQLLKRKGGKDLFLHLDHFAFDLVIVDEASQMPVDQATTLLPLMRRGKVRCAPLPLLDTEAPIQDVELLSALEPEALLDEEGAPLDPSQQTRIVFVGDHNQLPPVQQVEPPEKLRAILESAFSYFQKHLNVPSTQLQTNYRSLGEIVDYTNTLELYEHPIQAYFATHPGIDPLPSPPMHLSEWTRKLLEPARIVSAILHDSQFDTAVSELEARIVSEVVCGFYEQMAPSNEAEELEFWSEHLGIVSPHNAHGRLIIRNIHERMLCVEAPHTHLDGARLMQALSETIYSVEKFQGSARSFIIASMGISARDQLRAEETFIYDLNRLNVLTSRAVKKMLLVCSNNLLDYVPQTRRMIGPAARLRDYARRYCNVEEAVTFDDAKLAMRWHDANLQLDLRRSQPITLPPALLAARQKLLENQPPSPQTSTNYDEAALDKMLEGMPPEARALLMKKLME